MCSTLQSFSEDLIIDQSGAVGKNNLATAAVGDHVSTVTGWRLSWKCQMLRWFEPTLVTRAGVGEWSNVQRRRHGKTVLTTLSTVSGRRRSHWRQPWQRYASPKERERQVSQHSHVQRRSVHTVADSVAPGLIVRHKIATNPIQVIVTAVTMQLVTDGCSWPWTSAYTGTANLHLGSIYVLVWPHYHCFT